MPWEPIQLSEKDLEFIEFREIQAKKLGEILGIKPEVYRPGEHEEGLHHLDGPYCPHVHRPTSQEPRLLDSGDRGETPPQTPHPVVPKY